MLSKSVCNELNLPEYHVDTYNLTEMVAYWPVLSFILDKVKPSSIAEIGSNKGITTRLIHQYTSKKKIALNVIDPFLDVSVKLLDNINLFEMTSAEYFEGDNKSDVYFIDGDHNYQTVTIELESIKRLSGTSDLLCFMHDVGWPWARRDLYYNPANCSDKEYAYNQSLHLETDEFTYRGFPSGEVYAMAKQYGGAKNGVQTAIDDFLKSNDELTYIKIPNVYGLGILISKSLIDNELGDFFVSLKRILPMMSILEANRLRLIQGLDEHHYDMIMFRNDAENLRAAQVQLEKEREKLKSENIELTKLNQKIEASLEDATSDNKRKQDLIDRINKNVFGNLLMKILK